MGKSTTFHASRVVTTTLHHECDGVTTRSGDDVHRFRPEFVLCWFLRGLGKCPVLAKVEMWGESMAETSGCELLEMRDLAFTCT